MRRLLLGLLTAALGFNSIGCGDSGEIGAGGSGAAGGSGGTLGSGTVEGWPPTATVYFDENRVLSVDCETDEDCWKVLGYYHAFDRFVQMDFRRRFATGRLADIVQTPLAKAFGIADVAARTRQLFSTPEGEPIEDAFSEKVSPEFLAVLEAYAVGVNQWIADVQNGANGAKLPREFEAFAFNYDPEDIPEWTPKDSLSCSLLLFDALTNNELSTIALGVARDRIADDIQFSDLYARRPIKQSSVLEPGTWNPSASLASSAKSLTAPDTVSKLNAGTALRALHQALEDGRRLQRLIFAQGTIGQDLGSNNWIVSPSKTSEGNALLSNDPHLGLSNPAVWYLANLDSKTNGSGNLHVAGHTFAGIPLVFVGHNDDIAWGVTTTTMDFSDVYVEQLVTDDDGEPTGVLFRGEEVDFIRKPFTVQYNDGSSEERELLFVPHHGPVRGIDVEEGVALTLRWTGQDVDTDLDGYGGLATATTVEEARQSLELITSAGQNFVLIDRNGDIGWFPYNRLPKRNWATNLDGAAPPWLPLPGSGDFEWNDNYFAIEELPQAFNPADGFIATANNDMTGALFDNDPTNEGPPYQVAAAAGYRHAQIVRLLQAGGDEHSVQTMLDTVGDTHSFIGEEMSPAILDIATDMNTELTESAQKVVNALRAWDFECPTGLDGTNSQMSPLVDEAQVLLSSAGCAAFHVAIAELETAITADENKAFDPEEEPVPPPGSGPNYAAFYSIVDPSQLNAGDIYWDDIRTPETETRFDIMGAALDTAGEFLRTELGDDETQWAWGRLHGAILVSDLEALGVPGFNNPASDDSSYANDGGLFTVDVANPNEDFRQTAGPSTRFVCEASAEAVSCSYQLPGGQSGDIDSPHYDDLLDEWLANEPMELIYNIDEAAQNAATPPIRLGQ